MKWFSSKKHAKSDAAPKVSELVQLVVAYAKQEVIDPIRGIGRWLAFGLVAVVFLNLGILMLAIGALRLLQFEIFNGSTTWSFVPYLIVMVVSLLVVGLAIGRINKKSLHLGRRS